MKEGPGCHAWSQCINQPFVRFYTASSQQSLLPLITLLLLLLLIPIIILIILCYKYPNNSFVRKSRNCLSQMKTRVFSNKYEHNPPFNLSRDLTTASIPSPTTTLNTYIGVENEGIQEDEHASSQYSQPYQAHREMFARRQQQPPPQQHRSPLPSTQSTSEVAVVSPILQTSGLHYAQLDHRDDESMTYRDASVGSGFPLDTLHSVPSSNNNELSEIANLPCDDDRLQGEGSEHLDGSSRSTPPHDCPIGSQGSLGSLGNPVGSLGSNHQYQQNPLDEQPNVNTINNSNIPITDGPTRRYNNNSETLAIHGNPFQFSRIYNPQTSHTNTLIPHGHHPNSQGYNPNAQTLPPRPDGLPPRTARGFNELSSPMSPANQGAQHRTSPSPHNMPTVDSIIGDYQYLPTSIHEGFSFEDTGGSGDNYFFPEGYQQNQVIPYDTVAFDGDLSYPIMDPLHTSSRLQLAIPENHRSNNSQPFNNQNSSDNRSINVYTGSSPQPQGGSQTFPKECYSSSVTV